MNANDVLRVFNIPATKLITHKDVQKWRDCLKSYRDFNDFAVETEYKKLVELVGSEKPLFYYLSAVRRRLLDRQHEAYKRLPVVPQIQKLFKEEYCAK